jgi:hypothetical protein
MKLLSASLLLIASSSASATTAMKTIDASSESIPANSIVGKRLLSVARRVNNDNQGGEADMSWVANYSLKFDKCATTNEYYGGYFGGNNNGQNQNQQQNNGNNNRNGYNGLYEQRLVHFKLCPTNTCSKGCTGGADYVVDMNEYVTTYFEYKAELLKTQCETAKANCVCDNADNGDNADGDNADNGDNAAEDGGEDAETVS